MNTALNRNLVMCLLVSSLVCLVGVNDASADMFYDANLVGFWQFSGDANDSSFYEHHGTLNGDADVSADILAVDGDGDYVEVQDDPDFRFTQRDSFSICFWAKPDSNSQGYVLTKMRSGDCYLRKFGYQVASNDSRFHFIIEKSCTGSTTVSTSADSAPPGAWHHVVMVYDYNGGNKDMKAYLNGKLDGTGAFAYNTGSTTPEKALAIGARSYDSTVTGYFDGQIDDVMVYDRALEAWEVRQLYNEANKVRVYADGAWRDLATW